MRFFHFKTLPHKHMLVDLFNCPRDRLLQTFSRHREMANNGFQKWSHIAQYLFLENGSKNPDDDDRIFSQKIGRMFRTESLKNSSRDNLDVLWF